jgi:hypothetical protein
MSELVSNWTANQDLPELKMGETIGISEKKTIHYRFRASSKEK